MSYQSTSGGSKPASTSTGRALRQSRDSEQAEFALQRPEDSGRQLPPLVPTSTTSRQSDVHSILNPPHSPTAGPGSVPIPPTSFTHGTAQYFPDVERRGSAFGTRGTSSPGPLQPQIYTPHSQPLTGLEGTHPGNALSATSLPTSPSHNLPTGALEQNYFGHALYPNPPSHRLSEAGQHVQVPSTTRWPSRYAQSRRASSAERNVQSNQPAGGSRPGQQLHYMTLETAQGPMPVPVNVQTASRAADEKRKRNAQASARFRKRTKEGKQASAREIDTLKQQIRDLEEDVDFYRGERDHYRGMVPERTRQHHPRQTSPRHFRPAVRSSESPPTSTSEGPSSVQEQDARDFSRRQQPPYGYDPIQASPSTGFPPQNFPHRAGQHGQQLHPQQSVYAQPHQAQYFPQQYPYQPAPAQRSPPTHSQQLPPIRTQGYGQPPPLAHPAQFWPPSTKNEPP